ncbi:MAG TPA: ChbG/HpnK family deacetylase, partial [Nitrospirota bacterium]
MKRLIVNADDFGMAGPVDLGIIRGHRDGIITSASLLAGGESAEHAASLARENPTLGVGAHLCLTGMIPVLDASKIPTITKDGRLLPGPLAVMSRLTFGLADRREIKAELT